MLPTTEIVLTETDETATEGSPKKKSKAAKAAEEAAATAKKSAEEAAEKAKKSASLAYKESKRFFRETSFTPAALRPADRTVNSFFKLTFSHHHTTQTLFPYFPLFKMTYSYFKNFNCNKNMSLIFLLRKAKI